MVLDLQDKIKMNLNFKLFKRFEKQIILKKLELMVKKNF